MTQDTYRHVTVEAMNGLLLVGTHALALYLGALFYARVVQSRIQERVVRKWWPDGPVDGWVLTFGKMVIGNPADKKTIDRRQRRLLKALSPRWRL